MITLQDHRRIKELEVLVTRSKNQQEQDYKRIEELEVEISKLRSANTTLEDIRKSHMERITELEGESKWLREDTAILINRIAELERENKRLDDHAKKWGIKAQQAEQQLAEAQKDNRALRAQLQTSYEQEVNSRGRREIAEARDKWMRIAQEAQKDAERLREELSETIPIMQRALDYIEDFATPLPPKLQRDLINTIIRVSSAAINAARSEE